MGNCKEPVGNVDPKLLVERINEKNTLNRPFVHFNDISKLYIQRQESKYPYGIDDKAYKAILAYFSADHHYEAVMSGDVCFGY